MTNNGIPFDAFALEELRRQYLSADVGGRIALLQGDTLPFEIARMAVDDLNVEVRQWFARHGRDYRESCEDGTGHFAFRFPDRNLLEILRNDHDRFVGASVYLNPAFSPFLDALAIAPGRALLAVVGFKSQTKALWSQATHFERLAMARSRWFSSELLELFDLANNELGLAPEARRELISASLAGDADRTNANEIWRLIAEWPEESDVPSLVYRFLPPHDETAAEIYRKCGTALRRAILSMVWENVGEQTFPYQTYSSTLNLAIKDTDEICRLLAYGALPLGWASWGFQRLWQRSKQSRMLLHAARNDIYALSGLAKNLSLSPRELRWVHRRAYALAGSLKSERNLRVSLGPDDERTISEADLPVMVNQDVARRIRELHFERWLEKLKVSDSSDSKVEWTQDEKFDYLTALSLNPSMWWVFVQCCGLASGLGLIVFFFTYVFSDSLALSLLLLFLCSWLGWLLAYLAVRGTHVLPPWINTEKYRERLKQLWGKGPRKPPLIEDRPAVEVEREREANERRRTFQEEYSLEPQRQRVEAHRRERSGVPRKIKRNWHLLKRKLRCFTRV